MCYETSEFYCIKCGNKGIPVQRPQARKREKFHRKKLYCPHCRITLNHIECKDEFDVKEFKTRFAAGEFTEEAVIYG